MRAIAIATGLLSIMVTQQAGRAEDPPRRYPFKSAIVTYSLSGEFENGTEKLYLDDYGRKSRTERTSTMTIMGMSEEQKTLDIDDGEFQYRIDLKEKKGTKMPSASKMAEAMFARMTAEQKEAMKQVGMEIVKGLTESKDLKPVGKGAVLGRECEIYDVMGVKTWQWKDLTLKMESPALGNMKQVATDLKVDCPIPAGTFAPPAGIALTDVSRMPSGPPEAPAVPSEAPPAPPSR